MYILDKIDEYLLKEWKIVKGYAGRDITQVFKEKAIVWYHMVEPIMKGLIWTLPNGDTFLNKKKLGNINFPNEKLSHKKVLSEFYQKLEFGKHMSGKLRKDVEKMNEMNIRGRIIKKEIHVYSFNTQSGPFAEKRYDNRVKKAIFSIERNIPEDYASN